MSRKETLSSSENHKSDASHERPETTVESSIAHGLSVIQKYVKLLPETPGVYRMINAMEDVLYVGKARHLRKRVASYTNLQRLPHRLQKMVAETVRMEFVTTHTEVEALLLEANFIKKFRPRYNVLLRDDKFFPYLVITTDHEFPQLLIHRGGQRQKGVYFGPFADRRAVTETLNVLQRLVLLRNCSDSFFAARTRPCLQYHIKRCTAPCVKYVTATQYNHQVKEALDFLSGHSRQLQEHLSKTMQEASDSLDFERAGQLRDRIRALTSIQTRQGINVPGLRDSDIIAAYQKNHQTCIQVFFFRNGFNNGHKAYFPRHDIHQPLSEILTSFIAQLYTDIIPPPTILLSHPADDLEILIKALSATAHRNVHIRIPPYRSDRKMVMEQALKNAEEALDRHNADTATQKFMLEELARVFDLPAIPQRIEVYDNSHTSGTDSIGAMIVASPEGFVKKAYRKFNIRNDSDTPFSPGDDYAMMREVFQRRFTSDTITLPDLVLIDGGAGQLNAAHSILDDVDRPHIPVIAIAKGPDRNAGKERFFKKNREPMTLSNNLPLLHFLQRLRDEAHRFAIGSHRIRRVKSLGKNPLDEIPGVGPLRKKALLHHFGSASAVRQAGLKDIAAVPGISEAVAKIIYEFFHPSS